MSDTAPSLAAAETELAARRAELDRLDDALHDLLMRRAEVVGEIGALGAKGAVKLRPGREASILRRLLGRHQGSLPRQAVVRLWRELFAATTAMQGPLVIAVCETDATAGFTQAAREHFGALTPLRIHGSPAQAIQDVSTGAATAAVLPMPSETEPQTAAWWTALLHKDDPRIHVVARLPFWTPRPEGAPRAHALVVAAIAPDATLRDRSLLGLEVGAEISRARLATALTAAGLAPDTIVLRRHPSQPVAQALVEVDGHVSDDDPRLAALGAPSLVALERRPVVLGAYAVPEGSP